MKFNIIKLRHAILDTDVDMFIEKISFIFRSKTKGHTMVFTEAGAFPAKETVEEIKALIKKEIQNETRD